MARLVILVVITGTALIMHFTRPSTADYLLKLEQRAATLSSNQNQGFSQLSSMHPLDEMVMSVTPAQALEQTDIYDYVIVRVFTTSYEHERFGPRRVRTYGLFSSLISKRE